MTWGTCLAGLLVSFLTHEEEEEEEEDREVG